MFIELVELVVLEQQGGMSKGADAAFRAVAAAVARKEGLEPPTVRREMLHRVAVVVARGCSSRVERRRAKARAGRAVWARTRPETRGESHGLSAAASRRRGWRAGGFRLESRLTCGQPSNFLSAHVWTRAKDGRRQSGKRLIPGRESRRRDDEGGVAVSRLVRRVLPCIVVRKPR